MQLIDKYLPYWPVFAASVLFFLLGLWWHLTAARAMELSPKPVGWVRNYRAGGFPFHRTLPRKPKMRWWLFALTVLLAVVFAAGRILNRNLPFSQTPLLFLRSRYSLCMILLYAAGAAAVYGMLILLFDSAWTAVPASLLFAASTFDDHGAICFLALSLLFLLLWLRAEKPGFPAELLYLASILLLAPLLAMRPAMLWLLPCWMLAHWYKLLSQRRSCQLTGGTLLLTLLASLAAWMLSLLLSVMLMQFLYSGFRFYVFLRLLSISRLKTVLLAALRWIPSTLLARPTRGMALQLLIDAPVLGFGFWGCRSAWILAKHRRDVRGVFILTVLAVLLVLWLLTGSYVLTLGLCLAAACVLYDADVGKKRIGAILLTAAGICWYICIQIAAWYVPLTVGLVERIL